MIKETFGCKSYKDKIGVLIAQLGTPEAPTKQALYPYLKQFLSDPRVIEKNRALWWVILRALVLPRRPARSAALYKRIWTDKGSPLLVITKETTEKLKESLQQVSSGIEVEFGMRYGNPSLESAVDVLIEKGCSKILLFPMYAQYSATTTASTYDAVFSHLLKRRWVPTLRVAEPYYLHPAFIKALATTINEAYEKFDKKPEKLVLSYHGIPYEYIQKGDPYCCMCTETTQALLQEISVPANEVIHTFQSRFGRDPWLEPYTDETIDGLAERGVKHIAVACPGFTADCLETLDEIGNEALHAFQEKGGERLDLIPCLNAHPTWIRGLTEIVTSELSSWLETKQRNQTKHCGIVCPTTQSAFEECHYQNPKKAVG